MTLETLSPGQVLSNSFLFTGIFTLVLNQLSSSGLLYKWSQEINPNGANIDNPLDLSTQEGRVQMDNYTRILGILCLTLSWSTVYGIGTVIGSLWITRETFTKGQKYALLALPLLYCFAIGNLISQLDIVSDSFENSVIGLILVTGGMWMTYLASKSEIVWSWSIFEWDDETEYFAWIDRVGMIAIAYFLIGAAWLIGVAEWSNNAEEITLFSIWAVYLIGIAIQGFRDETETPWRRGIGSFGSLFSIFMLSLAIDTEIFRYMLWMLLGIVAFGFGILYMNRLGEGTMIFEEQQVAQVPQVVIPQVKPVVETIEEPVQETKEEETAVIEDEFDAELEQTLEEIENPVEPEVKKLPTAKPIENAPQKQEFVMPAPVKQSLFDIKLDPTVMAIIQQRIAMTPHIGFRPVVNVQKNGNINLIFEKI